MNKSTLAHEKALREEAIHWLTKHKEFAIQNPSETAYHNSMVFAAYNQKRITAEEANDLILPFPTK